MSALDTITRDAAQNMNATFDAILSGLGSGALAGLKGVTSAVSAVGGAANVTLGGSAAVAASLGSIFGSTDHQGPQQSTEPSRAPVIAPPSQPSYEVDKSDIGQFVALQFQQTNGGRSTNIGRA